MNLGDSDQDALAAAAEISVEEESSDDEHNLPNHGSCYSPLMIA